MQSCEGVDVWVADLDAVPASLLGVLCDAERARAGRLLDERARRRWAASRAVLRDLLARAMGADPATLAFEVGAHGKLSARCLQDEAPHFNLSHSGSIALYAIGWGREVGVDVEVLGQRRAGGRNEVAIARRIMGAEVARRLQALDGAAAEREFLAAWVAHEATVKCLGHGLDALDAEQGAGGAASGAEDLWVTPLEVDPGALAALATRGGEASVSVRRWAAA